MEKKRYREIPDRINEAVIISILDSDLGNINSKPLTTIGMMNKLIINGYMGKRFGDFEKYAMLERKAGV